MQNSSSCFGSFAADLKKIAMCSRFVLCSPLSGFQIMSAFVADAALPSGCLRTGISNTATGNAPFLLGLQQHIGEHEAHECHEDDSLHQ